MTAISARLPSERGPGLAAAAVGLGVFGIVCGIGIAIGEVEALVAALTVLACLATLVDYRIGAVLLMIMLPVEGNYLFPHSVFGLTGLNPVNVLLAATLASYLLRGYELKRFLPNPLVWLFVVPIVTGIWLMSVAAIGYVLASGVSIGSLALPTSRLFFSGLGMHANDLGRLYAVAYALLLFTWGETKDLRLKTALLFTMGVLTIALILTFSRGAMTGWVLVNVLFLVWKFNAKTLGLALLAVGAGLLLMPGAVVSRMSMGLVGGGDMNEFSAGRVDEIWIPLLPELFKSPIWGSGLESTTWSHALWAEQMLPVTHPHNAYMQAILDMGLLGLALLLAFYWHVYRTCRDLGSNAYLSPTMRGFYQGVVAGLLCFIVTGFSGSSLRPTGEFAFLWIAIGMMYGQLARRRTGT